MERHEANLERGAVEADRGAYRDVREGMTGRRREVLEARRRELRALNPQVREVYTRRIARQVVGAMGIAGAALVVATSVVNRQGATAVLLATVAACLVVWPFARLAARSSLEQAFADAFASTGDAFRDVDRLEQTTPLRVVREIADRHERRSVWLPLAALCLITPFLLHFAVTLLFTLGNADRDALRSFDGWIHRGIPSAGPALLALGWMAWRYAGRVKRRPVGDMLGSYRGDGWEAYGVCVAVSAIWGVVHSIVSFATAWSPSEGYRALGLAVVPVLLVAVTCLAVVPPLFGYLHRRIARERLTLGYPK